MNIRIEESWKQALSSEFDKLYFRILTDFVRAEYTTRTPPVYPPAGLIFRAFDSCPFDQVKAVILGQDPYHGAGQAEGLAFSVPAGVAMPPSLVNILAEVNTDLGHPAQVSGGCLDSWANQGVLLLNSTLTVREHQAASHQGKGWETFTDAAIAALAAKRQNIVYMLWGSSARRKAAMIDRRRNLVLEAPHPSPLSAHRGFWGCRHFSQANAYFLAHGMSPVNW